MSQGGRDNEGAWPTSSGPAHLDGVIVEVRLVREKVEGAVRQLQALSLALQRITQVTHTHMHTDTRTHTCSQVMN